MPSREYLDKLFEAENEATALMDEARTEASRRVSLAKSETDAFEAESRAARTSAADVQAQAARKGIDLDFDAEIQAFRMSLLAIPADYDRFATWCGVSLDGIV
jgi:vacuolar-type H+-ATPase subunit H